jgi:hypothetical protein
LSLDVFEILSVQDFRFRDFAVEAIAPFAGPAQGGLNVFQKYTVKKRQKDNEHSKILDLAGADYFKVYRSILIFKNTCTEIFYLIPDDLVRNYQRLAAIHEFF